VERKPDDLAIGAFFDELASQPWLGYKRRFWPQFLFHVTDIQNAVSILTCGHLLCRNRALAEQRMTSDNASAEILWQSAPWLFDHVRFYFRPRTPTFYRNEGIRPAAYRQMDAHCPVPVALLFDVKSVAGRTGVLFSDGNLASVRARLGDNVAFLQSLDFKEIYHDQRMPAAARERLTARRQAEVIVPGELGLDALRFVVTRSPAERLTLLSLLSETSGAGSVQPGQILVDPRLFFGRWTFVEDVKYVGQSIRLLFNPDSETPGPFVTRYTWANPHTGDSVETTDRVRALGHVTVTVPEAIRGSHVHLTLHLDNAMAFSAQLEQVPSTTLIAPW
jgi:hypothetical protein